MHQVFVISSLDRCAVQGLARLSGWFKVHGLHVVSRDLSPSHTPTPPPCTPCFFTHLCFPCLEYLVLEPENMRLYVKATLRWHFL